MCVDASSCGAACIGATAAAVCLVAATIGLTACIAMEEAFTCFPAIADGIAAFVAAEATTARFATAIAGFSTSVTLVGLDFVTFTTFDIVPLATANNNMTPVACFIVYLAVT
mmetsp:Transcript_24030/g.46756  ORF Transcript_24030/g.46756 Transcript_24030/m.46756 type:complete len:112 (-) Transcript_24030:52-387(-)